MKRVILFFCFIYLNFSYAQDIISGRYDSKSNMFIQTKMDYWISEFNENKLGKISKLGFYGVINSLGELIIPIKYDRIIFYKNSIYAKKSNYVDVFDSKGNKMPHDFSSTRINLIRSIYIKEIDKFIDIYNNDLSIYNEGLFPFEYYDKSKNKYRMAFADSLGNIKINNPDYFRVKRFSNGLAAVYNKSGKCGYINKSGKQVIPLIYVTCNSFKEKSAVIKKGEKYGIINRSNKIKVPFEYDYIIPSYNDIITVKKEKKYGFINKENKTIIELKYDNASSFVDGVSRVKLNGEHFFINKNDKRFDNYQHRFIDGYRYMRYGTDEYYEDKLKNKIFKLTYDFGYGLSYKDGLSKVKMNNKYGFIDRLGNEVIPVIYDEAKKFKFGKGIVKLDNEWILIDKSGEKITTIIHSSRSNIFGFDEHGFLTITRKGKRKGLINSDGKVIIPPKFDKIKKQRGYFFVELNGKKGVYDYKGNQVLKTVHNKLFYKPNNFCIVHSKDYLSIYDKKFNLLREKKIDTVFSAPKELKKPNRYYYFYKSNNKIGYINLSTLDFNNVSSSD